MAKILKSRGIAWDDMFKVGRTIECEYDCQIGDIIDECFVYLGRSPDDNTCKKGDVTLAIPLKFIDIVETHSDLSQYGFSKANKEDRWIRK